MHYHFNKEKQILMEKEITNLIPISEKQVNELLEKNIDIHFEYIIFLKEIGSGNINNILDLKDFIFDFNDLGLEDIYNIPENIKLFGDNFSGDFIGVEKFIGLVKILKDI